MKIATLVIVIVIVVTLLPCTTRISAHPLSASPGLNSQGGDITIINARVWTGDPDDPWKESITVRDGKIVALDDEKPAGEVIDAEGRLVVPGMWDSHCHPHVPFVLISPEAPMLQGARSVEAVQERLRNYVKEHPEDKYPRMFGWLSSIFKDGVKPTRQLLDEVVSDRPVFLSHSSGHIFWANTKALEVAGILESDPPDAPSTARIERDPETGLATGLLEETEFAGTDGLLLRSVEKVGPLSPDMQALALYYLLAEYPKVGITGVWTKDGNANITLLYRTLLENDALPVRAVLDTLYTTYSDMSEFEAVAALAEEIANDESLPPGFLRADAVKLLLDMIPSSHQSWFFEPYADGIGGSGMPVFDMEDFEAQVLEADRLGLQVNFLSIGDRAVHEALNILERVEEVNPPRDRRHILEHADFIIDEDIPRFREIGAIVSMNPIGAYPDMDYQGTMRDLMGEERLNEEFERWKDLIEAGAVVVNGSDFPLAPMDPMVGMHILVNGTDINGQPEGGLWPDKQISVEDALRTYTVNAAYAAFNEDRLGQLKVGYDADFVMLSEDILDPSFDTSKLAYVKAALTVLNGHVVHEDFSDTEKTIEFGK